MNPDPRTAAPPARVPLRLRAHDAEDIKILSTLLQDALVRSADMSYRPREHRFVMVANRFCWERIPPAHQDGRAVSSAAGDARFADDVALYERIHCGVCVDHVSQVRFRNLSLAKLDHIHDLLSLHKDDDGIGLLFAGGGEIKLTLATVQIFATDLGESWPTLWRPGHGPDGDRP